MYDREYSPFHPRERFTIRKIRKILLWNVIGGQKEFQLTVVRLHSVAKSTLLRNWRSMKQHCDPIYTRILLVKKCSYHCSYLAEMRDTLLIEISFDESVNGIVFTDVATVRPISYGRIRSFAWQTLEMVWFFKNFRPSEIWDVICEMGNRNSVSRMVHRWKLFLWIFPIYPFGLLWLLSSEESTVCSSMFMQCIGIDRTVGIKKSWNLQTYYHRVRSIQATCFKFICTRYAVV